MDLVAVITKLWDAWDVRVMVLLSLFLQALLSILGNRRKYTVKPWVGILLWLAYQCADPVAIAALGKLSSSCVRESGVSNTLRGWWASLLLLHLGGPDTITAYSMEDNLLWKRHLLALVTQVSLAIYVIVLSWTRSWLSLLNFPLFLAGVIKYSERTWCLYSASSKDSRRQVPLFDGRMIGNMIIEVLAQDQDQDQESQVDDRIAEIIGTSFTQESQVDEENVVLAYHWFAFMRHDIRNLFSTTGNLGSLKAKTEDYYDGVPGITFQSIRTRLGRGRNVFDSVPIESGFTYDMLYTKSGIIFSKLGCILRLISFCCSSCVLVFFLQCFSTGNSPQAQQHRSRVDICITGILVAGAVAFEFYGLFLILSSDWFVVLAVRENKSRLLRGIFRCSLLIRHREKRRWSDCMGQFNLLRYCQSFRGGSKILEMIGIDELMHKYWHTSFRSIPLSLKKPESFPDPSEAFQFPFWEDDFIVASHFTRGEKALQRHECTDKKVKETLAMDLSATIIIWHIATHICYPHPVSPTTDEKIATCKAISDYMMYLVAKKPSMVSEDDNFWFDSVSGKLRGKWRQNTIPPTADATIYQRLLVEISMEEIGFTPSRLILDRAVRVAEVLSSRAEEQWDIMRSVWLEMMHYAAMRCPHVSHLQELSQGGEILSLYWLLASYNLEESSINEDELE